MDPLQAFGLAVYRAWSSGDYMDMDGCDIQDLAEASGMVEEVPYNIAEHGEYMRDAWDLEEGDPCFALTASVKGAISNLEQNKTET